MCCREHGLALVTVILLVAVLMVIGLLLSDKVIRATRDVSRAAAHDQGLQAAGAGIESARHQLAETYLGSRGWANYLATAPGGERYPDRPAFTLEVGGAAVEIYLRDNPDGDGDPRRDNDLQLFVLARARATAGGEVLIESLCRYEPPTGVYRQEGGDSRRSGQTPAEGLAEPWASQVTALEGGE